MREGEGESKKERERMREGEGESKKEERGKKRRKSQQQNCVGSNPTQGSSSSLERAVLGKEKKKSCPECS